MINLLFISYIFTYILHAMLILYNIYICGYICICHIEYTQQKQKNACPKWTKACKYHLYTTKMISCTYYNIQNQNFIEQRPLALSQLSIASKNIRIVLSYYYYTYCIQYNDLMIRTYNNISSCADFQLKKYTK